MAIVCRNNDCRDNDCRNDDRYEWLMKHNGFNYFITLITT